VTHEYPPVTTEAARKLHPRAAIIRHEVGKTIVFETAGDAVGHPTARVDAQPTRKLNS
jgi:hypothetical protein